jgi:CRISPR-associated protein Csm1
MNSNREKIYLAALLHDIGKFYQRADVGSVANSKYLNQRNKVESTFLPQRNGFYSHKHCLWTAQFIDDNISVFKTLLNDDNAATYLTDQDNFYNLAARHHLSADQLSDLGKIIKEADCLSSGMDRDSVEAFKDDQDESSWDSFKTKRMTSILEYIQKNDDKFVVTHHLPLTELNLTKEFFPKKDFSQAPDYISLWNNFLTEFKFIQADTYKAFAETFLSLLYKYTVTIPSSTINFPDVSLYDHSKTTAALAICLYDYYQSGEKNNNEFLLIGGDFSGIQSYIYKIVSKYAAKNLKGRSFYLRMLSDAIVRFLLQELDLFQANIVYNSGGSFYILAPNTSEVKESLHSAIGIIEKQLFNTHKTDLFVAIDYVELSKDTLMHKTDKTLSDVWGDLFQKRDIKKKTKFASLLEDKYNLFFEPFGIGYNKDRDVISGEEFLPEERPFILAELSEFDNENPIKEITAQQILLGKYLRDADMMVISEDEIPYWRDLRPIEPLELGFYYYFVTKDKLEQKRKELCASADKISIITFNGKDLNCNFINDSINGINNIYGLEFYGGNTFDNTTFEDMCSKDDENAFSRLGVLRMDVDNLGSIFQKGISPERVTLSRLAALSRSFDYFFSGYINRIQSDLGENKSFIVYSGGDDLFVVGEWTTMIDFAKRIRSDFREFTCFNPAFSISGGIAVIPKKFPIIKGAQMSADEEDNAKKHTLVGGKNSLSFMEMPLNWNEEFPIVEQLKDKIVGYYLANKLPKSFISKVVNFSQQAKFTKTNKIGNYKIYWLFTYDINRLITRTKKDEVDVFLQQCISDVCSTKKTLDGKSITTNYHPLQLWAFACRWAELTIRTNK